MAFLRKLLPEWEHCTAGIVRDPDDQQFLAAMIEKLAHRRRKIAAIPFAAKTALEHRVAGNFNGSIEGATKRTANECCRGFLRHVDGLIHRRDFCDRDAAVNCI